MTAALVEASVLLFCWASDGMASCDAVRRYRVARLGVTFAFQVHWRFRRSQWEHLGRCSSHRTFLRLHVKHPSRDLPNRDVLLFLLWSCWSFMPKDVLSKFGGVESKLATPHSGVVLRCDPDGTTLTRYCDLVQQPHIHECRMRYAA